MLKRSLTKTLRERLRRNSAVALLGSRRVGKSTSALALELDKKSHLYLVRFVPAWEGKVEKRLVKAPKVYWRDSGLLHTLVGLRPRRGLRD